MILPRFFIPLILATALLVVAATVMPLLLTAGPGPSEHLSVRGETVVLYGYGPYRHMPADVAVQGHAQDLVTLLIGIPVLLLSLSLARQGSKIGYFALTGAVGYLFVQYVLYLAMATYNELFLVWVVLVLLLFQALVRLLLLGASAPDAWQKPPERTRRYVGWFLIVNSALIALLWFNVILPPIIDGRLYPEGLAHFTTMVVQGFDLALFLPPSLLAGCSYLLGKPAGSLLAPLMPYSCHCR